MQRAVLHTRAIVGAKLARQLGHKRWPGRRRHCRQLATAADGPDSLMIQQYLDALQPEDQVRTLLCVVSLHSQPHVHLSLAWHPAQVMQDLRRATAVEWPKAVQMLVSPPQARLLAWLVGLTGARRVLEVGTFTGFSALAIARVQHTPRSARCVAVCLCSAWVLTACSVRQALPADGHLTVCERDERPLVLAQRFWERVGVRHKVPASLSLQWHACVHASQEWLWLQISVKLGLAADSLAAALEDGQAGSFDLAFIGDPLK